MWQLRARVGLLTRHLFRDVDKNEQISEKGEI
jgi:hypothetical protein